MSKPLELKTFRWIGPLLDGRYLPPDIRPYVQVYQAEVEDGHLTVIVGQEPSGWHLSISHRKNLVDPFSGRHLPGRIPHYEELKAARYRFCPMEVCMAQLFPGEADFVNEHPTTLHLWEVPAELAR